MTKWIIVLVAVSVATAGCTVAPPSSPKEAVDVSVAAVERRPLVDALTPRPALPDVAGGPSSPAAQPAIVLPPNTLYVCVVDVGGVRKQTAIAFAPKVEELCTKHPEMGPCQYERNACRRSGGRIYVATGMEITMATEAEYDKKVLRVRFKGG